MTKSGWNRSKYVEAISLRSVARRKKERKKEETSKIQDPAGASGRVKTKNKETLFCYFLVKISKNKALLKQMRNPS